MTNSYKIITYVLTGILLMLFIISIVLTSVIDKKNKKIVDLDEQLYKCINAPIKIDTVYDTIYLTQIKYIYPKAKGNPNKDEWEEFKRLSQSVAPTSNIRCGNISSSYYSEVYEKEGVKIAWNALSECNNDSAKISFLEFSDIIIPKEIITKTIQIDKPIETPAKIKNKFLLYGGTMLKSFDEFPGIEAGAGVLYKQNWVLTIGGTHVNKQTYGSIRLCVTF